MTRFRNAYLAAVSLAVLAIARPAAAQTPPAPAASAGYSQLTFGGNVTINSNWYKSNFFGTNPAAVNAVQNGDGSVTITGGGNTFNEQLVTAQITGSTWQGIAFGGGGYFEATLSWSGTYDGSAGFPSWWSNDIEHMFDPTAGHWQGQAAGYSDWIEPDFLEYHSQNNFGNALHNWYGINGSNTQTNTNLPTFTLPGGTLASGLHRYGFLWIPATATTQGSAKFYFDGTQTGSTVTWNQFNPALAPPPVAGTSAYSVLDVRHLALILGSGNNAMNVTKVEVWQASTAGNIYQGVAPPTAGNVCN